MHAIHSASGFASCARQNGIGRKHRRSRNRGFTLIELIVVMGVILILGAVSMPSIMSVLSGQAVNQASSKVAGLMEFARQHAMTHQTYVRVGIAEGDEGETILLPIYAADGTTSGNMNKPREWPLVRKPLVLREMEIDNNLNITGSGISTNNDSLPSDSNITGFSRTQSGQEGSALSFSKVIQFNPHGEAQVEEGTTARHIKIAMARLGNGDDPFIVRIAGAGGQIRILRKEDDES